ncbi:cupredoxin domain-containing protein [Leptolyngbya ohadii]|uniref:cupredoxin domain-containing protein n=1 Tax=Leptolyngbya ohadii TaxID=1962290 RepID=UPI0015C648EB|nr:cupredoxin domain-containing protein [Leptolyngbya ohadii]
MKSRRLIGTLAGFSLLLGGSGAIALSAMEAGIAAPENGMEMPHGSTSNQEFQKIDQPLGVKLGVTAAGVGLIGLELWWFLGSKPKARKAQSQKGIQELDIAVDGGYEPNRIVVQAGQPVRLNFFRKDPTGCLEQVLIPDFRIAKDLPLNKRTAIEFTPQQPGDYPFTCGMNMYRGVIQVVSSSQPKPSEAQASAAT